MKRWVLAVCFLVMFAVYSPAQTAADAAADLVKQGQQRLRDGDLEGAIALYLQGLEANPDSYQAHSAAGIALDFAGRYEEARRHFARAMELAPDGQTKARARRNMAMSYAFERNCSGAERYEAPLYQDYLAAKDFYMAGEIANELARVCLESGAIDKAEEWYRKGYEAGVQEPNIPPDRKDLWDFRWEHALGRIAARRGNRDAALKHVSAAKAVLDKGTNPAQAPFFPYLVGYVELYTGSPAAALAELQKASQNDAFVQLLMAEAYEKLGDQEKAAECYRKILRFTAHNPNGALSRPVAQKKLQ